MPGIADERMKEIRERRDTLRREGQRRDMAQPQLQIEQRLDRIEKAISTMASWLVQAQTGFGQQDAEGIEKILRGEKEEDASQEE